jgi:hypothetical protein
MNKEKLFSLMPTEVVKEDDVNKKIEEQREIIKAGKSFVSQLSINRYLYKKLVHFDVDERLNLFSVLCDYNFVYSENGLCFSDLDIGTFACVLEEFFNLEHEKMYELDNLYIENLLKGKDITKEVLTLWEDKTMSFEEILGEFVFHTGGMSIGDTPNLMLMLIVKKALLGSYLSERNVESLLNNQREIYNISILM